MKTQVLVRFNIVGFHNYPKAPNEVKFLSNKHRHIFTIKAGYNVTDLDREKEIFIQSKQLEDYLYESYGSPCEFGEMSCEMIAKELLEFSFDDNMVWCEVWEESTGGARVEL